MASHLSERLKDCREHFIIDVLMQIADIETSDTRRLLECLRSCCQSDGEGRSTVELVSGQQENKDSNEARGFCPKQQC